VYLLREMDTMHDLLDHLLNDGVLKEDEKLEIDELRIARKRCEKLLTIIRRKTMKQYEIFLAALDKTNQSHVADVLRQEGSFSLFVTKKQQPQL